MIKLLKYIFVILLTTYWTSTLLFLLPNSFIRIQVHDYVYKFSQLFQQRWNYFAPPPKSNYELTYTYFKVVNRDTIFQRQYKALYPIYKSKQEKKPFNSKEEIIDYALNNAIIDLLQGMNKIRNVKKLKYPTMNDSLLYIEVSRELDKSFLFLYPTHILYNYGVRIARENNFNKNYLMKITILDLPITKFSERNIAKQDTLFNIIYESKFLKDDEKTANLLSL